MTRAEQSAIITDYIEKQLPVYKELALDIHNHPEVSNNEVYSSDVLINQLKKEGFDVKKKCCRSPYRI